MQSLTTEELAERLNIAPRTLEGWRLQDPPQGPPFVRIGRQVRYPISSVIDWLAEQITIPPEKEAA